MKNQLFLRPVCIALALITIVSCSNNDDGFTASASDINVTIEENPYLGQILGVISTNLEGNLTSVIDNSAIGFDTETNEVYVVNPSAFDYENNAQIVGTITLSNDENSATSNITINISDIVDSIQPLLTTSLNLYIAANDGDWVKVTEQEYNLIATTLNNITKNSTTDEQYEFANIALQVGLAGNTEITMANNNNVTIPPASYCFAFRYYIAGGYVDNDSQIKISSDTVTGAYENFGGPLPAITFLGDHYYILKGNNTPTTQTSYLAVHTRNMNLGYKVIDEHTDYYYSYNNATNLDTNGGTNSALIMFQGLSTTQKQWD
ncbi:hypothetical protein [Winogradskyella sp. 3972H.M.0a.05]|uniref:hypothetical protein n=1 Tax=Winogradskyella sp. 3972H.M.0a.05 TaxID=2950277 RepID=UPI00339A9C78